MFNIGSGEMVFIAVAALLILGPKRLPELARGLGKFMREFRRQTDDVRNVVEREFYRMDDEVNEVKNLVIQPAEGTQPNQLPPNTAQTANTVPAIPHEGELPPPQEAVPSQFTAGAAQAVNVHHDPTPPPAAEPTEKDKP